MSVNEAMRVCTGLGKGKEKGRGSRMMMRKGRHFAKQS